MAHRDRQLLTVQGEHRQFRYYTYWYQLGVLCENGPQSLTSSASRVESGGLSEGRPKRKKPDAIPKLNLGHEAKQTEVEGM